LNMAKILFLFPLLSTVLAGGPVHDWDYDSKSIGRADPAHWFTKYPSCGGQRQSPIDIVNPSIKADSSLAPLTFLNYSQHLDGLVLLNDGHSLRVNLPATSNLRLSSPSLPAEYRLSQFHFHWPSEHEFNGKRLPLELHLVHTNTKLADAQTTVDSTGLVVVAVTFNYNKQGADASDTLKALISKMGAVNAEGKNVTLQNGLVLSHLLPQDLSYVRYGGSLTTPPCAEVVEFHILTHSLPITQSEVKRFQTLTHGVEVAENQEIEDQIHNDRPLQNLNGRALRLHGSRGDL